MDHPCISGAVSTTRIQRFLVRGRYPANLGVVSAYSHVTEYGGTIGPAQCRLISRLRYTRLRVATLPRSVEVWGLHSLIKGNLLGTDRLSTGNLWRGGFVPFFIYKILQGHQWLFSAIVVFSFSFELLTQGVLDQY